MKNIISLKDLQLVHEPLHKHKKHDFGSSTTSKINNYSYDSENISVQYIGAIGTLFGVALLCL